MKTELAPEVFQPSQHYELGGFHRLLKVHEACDQLDYKRGQALKGQMLAVVANYVPDEVWNYCFELTFGKEASRG